MLDSDDDALPDAFEVLVTKTSPTNPDSNSNGIRDGDETGNNGLPWRLELVGRNAAIVFATGNTALEGVSCGQVTVYLPFPAPSGGAAVRYQLSGSAVPGLDFTNTPAGNLLMVPTGQSSATFSVCAVDDTEDQDFERTVEVILTNCTSSAVDSQPAGVSLIDNDLPAVRVFAFPPWVRKPSRTYGTNTAGFFFVRDGDASSAASLTCSIGGNAVGGTDYEFFGTKSLSRPASAPITCP
jgi:hypothetical protein